MGRPEVLTGPGLRPQASPKWTKHEALFYKGGLNKDFERAQQDTLSKLNEMAVNISSRLYFLLP